MTVTSTRKMNFPSVLTVRPKIPEVGFYVWCALCDAVACTLLHHKAQQGTKETKTHLQDLGECNQ